MTHYVAIDNSLMTNVLDNTEADGTCLIRRGYFGAGAKASCSRRSAGQPRRRQNR